MRKDRDIVALTRLLVVMGLFLLVVVGSNKYVGSVEGSDNKTITLEPQGGLYSTLFDFFVEEQEDGGGASSSGGGSYFSSIFADFEFIFRVKNYKALEDDNLAEMDHMVH